MTDWMEGYTSDIEYTAGYYKELTPKFLNMCAVAANVEPIDETKSFKYLELGCGHGLSLLVNAAIYPNATFYGVDYNPEHIAHARAIAKEANLTNIYFYENSFQEIVDTPEFLPEFEYIVFHGIYTWVNDENRDNLVKICKRHLLSGGMVYNSYNTKPGWLTTEPIQQLILRLSNEHIGNSIEKIEKIINQLEDLKNIDMGYFKTFVSDIDFRLNKMNTESKNYTVHEYMHEKWKAFYFPEVCEDMEKAKLNFLCVADISEAYLNDVLPENLSKKILDLKDYKNIELIKDLSFNRAFRRDLYVRGRRKKLSNAEKIIWFSQGEWIVLNKNIPENFEFNLIMGKVHADTQMYKTILELFVQHTHISTNKLVELTGFSLSNVVQALILLFDHGYISTYEKYKNKVNDLNKIITKNMFTENAFKYICFPNGKFAKKFDTVTMAFLRACYDGFNTKDKIVNHVYNLFSSRGVALVKDGKQLMGEDMLQRLYELEEDWRKNVYSHWIELGLEFSSGKKRK